ncbi:MAG: TetR family transcriptional regulator [Bifidobacterium sp.]|uniref:TetR family transcriptional regulator n=1 Tax=Bifidobacterium sp. TaxID=41200 RepID=UPI0039EAE2A9
MTFSEQPYEAVASRRGSRETKRIMASGRPQAQQRDGSVIAVRASRSNLAQSAPIAPNRKISKPAKRRGAGRPPVLSPEEIGRAALAMGLEGLTFLALSKRLGVSQATLYRYAPTKDDVLQLALEVGLAGLELNVRADDSWRSLFMRTVERVWNVLGAMPGAADAISRGIVCAKLMRSSQMLDDALAARGFSVADAAFAVDMVFDIVLDQRRGTDMLDLDHCAKSDDKLDNGRGTEGGDAESAWASRHVDRERFKADWAKTGQPDDAVSSRSVASHSVASSQSAESRSDGSQPMEAVSVSSPSAPSSATASQALIAADRRTVMLRKVDIALAGFEASGMIRSS